MDPLLLQVLQDLGATLLAFTASLAWLRSIDTLAAQGRLPQNLSRKIIHVGTGPLFVLCWLLFSDRPLAPYLAALVPLVLTGQFLAIGLGWLSQPATVQALTRTGDPKEILLGPFQYGLGFVVCTIVFWRHSPVGILALMILCGGDGLADIVGRRFGTHKLPFNPQKSWAGSAAMGLGGLGFSLLFLALFNHLGYFHPPLTLWPGLGWVVAISGVATVIEALPLGGWDNLAILTITLLLGSIGFS